MLYFFDTGWRMGPSPGLSRRTFFRNTKRSSQDSGFDANLVGGIINLLREAAEFVYVRTENDVSPDPTDNAFCACAEQGHAAFIATLNRKDFPQQKLVAKVISPGDPIPTTRRRRSSLGG